jgi:selenocysteine-specific elongation factor
MLVGAGEVDAALVVVAADEGPRAQTLEHVEILDALELTEGIAVVTKADLLDPGDEAARVAAVESVRALLAPTTLAGSPVLLASATTGEGLETLREALVDLRDRVLARAASDAGATGRSPAPRLAIDRVFAVRGHGTVVTGSLIGGPIAPGATLRVEPAGGEVRVRGLQVHGRAVERVDDGRAALNLAGSEPGLLRRGQVLTSDPAVLATRELLVRLRRPPTLPGRANVVRGVGTATSTTGTSTTGTATTSAAFMAWPSTGTPLRLHLGTDQAEAIVARSARTLIRLPDGDVIARLRLDRVVAAAAGDRLALRRSSPALTVAGGVVLDPRPPAGTSRRRATPERLLALAEAGEPGLPGPCAALLELHGALPTARWLAAGGSAAGDAGIAGSLVLARDVREGISAAAVATVVGHHDAEPDSAGVPLGALRTAMALDLRRRALVSPPDASSAASAILDELSAGGRLARDGDRVRDPARGGGLPPALAGSMDRLETLLAVAAPPSFADAVRQSGCPAEGVRTLETSGRIVRLDTDLGYATTMYRELAARALELAGAAPLTPAAFRDATGTSRKYALAILEDLGRRGVLRRGPDGHLPGPRAGVPGALP